MSLDLDIEDDFDFFDGVETVTFIPRTPAGAETTYTGVKALRRAVGGSLYGAGGGAQGTQLRTRWHLKKSTLAVTPKRGDRLVSTQSGTWEVDVNETNTFSTRYTVTCVRVSA